MAGEQILHNTSEIVDDSGKISNSALYDSGVTANVYSSNNTQLVNFTVTGKGVITAASESSINVTGVTYGNTSAHTHAPNQRIYISTSTPPSGTGNNGDIWYQTLT